MRNLLALMRKDNIVTIDWSDEVLAKTILTHASAIHDDAANHKSAQTTAKVA
jgi:NAD(P) transhydrogenase subunit alpha